VKAQELVAGLKARGILASTVGPDSIRFVTHYDVSRAACVKAVEAMSEVMETAVAKA
jgi:threonine aldolase